jgi:hypothetical protein
MEAVMNRNTLLPGVLLAVLLAISCSGGGSSNPVLPGQPDLTSDRSQTTGAGDIKALWGVWEIGIDPATWEVNIIPLRGPQYTVDVVTFLQKPLGNPANLTIQVTDTSEWLSQGLIGVDVGLRHPFPGLDQFTGFDVYGVFVAPGSIAGQYDGNVMYTNGADEPILLNSDGYTRWMNPSEFPADGTILRFVPGKLGTQNIGLFTSTINAYKYFADGLEKDQDVVDYFTDPLTTGMRGTFKPGSFNFREYDLQFPMVSGVPHLVFQYAVIASWLPPDETLSGDPDVLDVPGDFALSANADEAIYVGVTDESTLYYKDGKGGGTIKLGLEVLDWGVLKGMTVLDEVYKIVVEGNPGVVPGGYEEFDQVALSAVAAPGSTAISSVFEVEITGCTPMSNDDLTLLITVENTMPDTFDPGTGIPGNDDRLAGYLLAEIPVFNEIPWDFAVVTPNGGETLYMLMDYEITWNTDYAGVTDVAIEWSTDDFVSDIQTIVGSTPNDGSYIWDPIPKVMTDTAKVRVRDVGGAISDDSDDYFSIMPPVWLDFQDPVTVSNSTVAFSQVEYFQAWDEISPAISQDFDGLAHICWHSEIAKPNDPPPLGSREARDTVIRSFNGDSWDGQGGFLFTSGGTAQEIHELRRDYMKLAPASNNTTFAAVWHWSIYFCLDVDHLINGHYYYNAYTLFNRIYKAEEIMADADYLYTVSDGDWTLGDGPGIYSYRQKTPNPVWPGWPESTDPVPTLNILSGNGELSHSRSWAFQDGLLVLAYYTNSGQIKLLRQTDYANDTWNDTEVIFNGTGYTQTVNPALCNDTNDRLFAVWAGKEQSSGEYQLLLSELDSPGEAWAQPIVIATSTTEAFDDQHVSAHNIPYELPNGEMEDLLLIGYEVDTHVYYQIFLVGMWDWLPPLEVDDPTETIRDPDTMCLSYNYNYDGLITWSTEVVPGSIGYGNWDIVFRNGDFTTP